MRVEFIRLLMKMQAEDTVTANKYKARYARVHAGTHR